MTCPHFFEGALARCAAVRGFIVPSLHERERYCRTDGEGCPTKRTRDRRGEVLSEAAYFAIWLPVSHPPDSERPTALPGISADGPPV